MHNLQCVEFELSANHMLANLSRREADLLIREQVPDQASLVTRKLGRAAFGHLRTRGHDGGLRAKSRAACRGSGSTRTAIPTVLAQSWVLELLEGAKPAMRVNNWLVLHDAVRGGARLAVPLLLSRRHRLCAAPYFGWC